MDTNTNYNPNNWSGQNNQNNPPKPPPPPAPEITVRTMKSDVEALKQTGGSNPTPRPFTPPEIKSMPTQPAASLPSPNQNFQRPAAPPQPSQAPFRPTPLAQSGPRPMASSLPSSGKTVSPQQFGSADDLPKMGAAIPPGKKKGSHLILILSLLVVGLAFAFLGYFVIFPKLFPSETSLAPITDNTDQTQNQNTVPPVVDQTPAAPVTPTSPTIPTVPAGVITHNSIVSTDAALDVTLASLDSASFLKALKDESQKTATEGALLELVFTQQPHAIAALNGLLPDASPAIANYFNGDFTTVVYYDENGDWAGYVFDIKPEFASSIQQINSAIESSSNLKMLFPSDPGTQSAAGFKSGQVGSIATRYIPFSKTGASLNIAWKGNRLILSTSFNGLKRILSGLQ